MSVAPDQPSDPTVRALVTAINTGDRQGFMDLLTEDATMSDDGTDRDLQGWTEDEIFGSNGRMDVEAESDGGRALVAVFTNDRWGAMRTAWRFEVADGRISRFETGQA
ncbi:nuclear transport factor 2 family protein [Streptomyces sp. NPDC052396]|uniref:nuclear transport factor 2 family protein n=1 Tax=Streptomyces sp. NPDC052396 TaxID=3365689 RepID=UPI0037D5B1E2